MTTNNGWSLIALSVIALSGISAFYTLGISPEAAEEESEIRTDVGVHTAEITSGTIARTITVLGTVDAAPATAEAPAARLLIAPPSPGIITKIHVVEGQHVTIGTPLVQLDDQIILSQLATAKNTLSYAEKDVKRTQELVTAGLASQQALQDAEKNHAAAVDAVALLNVQVKLLLITAPAVGIISQLHVHLGELADPVRPLLTLFDSNRVLINAAIPTRVIDLIKLEQSVIVINHDNKLPGKIIYIVPQVDQQNGTILARIQLSEPTPLIPGLPVSVDIVVEELHDQLLIPISALVRRVPGEWAISVVENNIATMLTVIPGLRQNGFVAITGKDLKAGLRIVRDEAYGLPDTTPVHILEP